MKQQSVVNHTIRQNDIPVLLHVYRVVTNTSPVKMLCPQKKKNALPYIFFKKKTRLSVGLLRIGPVFSVSVELCIGGLRQIAV